MYSHLAEPQIPIAAKKLIKAYLFDLLIAVIYLVSALVNIKKDDKTIKQKVILNEDTATQQQLELQLVFTDNFPNLKIKTNKFPENCLIDNCLCKIPKCFPIKKRFPIHISLTFLHWFARILSDSSQIVLKFKWKMSAYVARKGPKIFCKHNTTPSLCLVQNRMRVYPV